MVDVKSLARRTILDIARRRQRPGTGSRLSALKGRTAATVFPVLTRVLTGIPWAVAGAAATRMYMPERATRDLEIVVHVHHASDARKRLSEAGYRMVGNLSIGGSSWTSPDGQDVDMLESDAPWLEEALSQAQANRDAQGLPVLPLPPLVLMKIQAGRVQDLADVARMLGQASSAALNEVRSLFRRHAPEEIEDLESLISLGQMETGLER